MKILVTGFEPFGVETANPSSLATRLLPERILDAEIIKKELPDIFGKAADLLTGTIKDHSPDAVVCTGLAGGRKGITPELIAVNLRHANIPDNAGLQPEWEKVVSEGEDGLFSTLPIREMVKALQAAGICAEISKSAGTFVCNEVMYRLLSFHKKEYPGMMAGFIHLPYAAEFPPEGKDVFSMPLPQIRNALEICIREVVKAKQHMSAYDPYAEKEKEE